MALRGVIRHHKTIRLAQLLKLADCFAVGVLESLWHTAAEQTPNGAIGRMSNESIAAVIRYPGDADGLVAALVEAGFLDEHPLHRLVIHNWHKRSDDTLDAKLYRQGERYACGTMPRGTKVGKAEKERADALYWRRPAALFAVPESAPADSALFSAEQRLPEPVPEPEPVPAPEPEPVSCAHSLSAAQALQQAGQDVLLHCSVSGTSAAYLQSSICAAIETECRRVDKPPELHAQAVALLMIANYAEYIRVGPALEYRWKPKTFFEEGHWRNWQNWPIDRERERQMVAANVGVVQ